MRFLLPLLLTLQVPGVLAESAPGLEALDKGKAAYDFYCYQCHAYAGTGQTQSAYFLDPPPRDFTRADPGILTRERMLSALREGRPGTAMKPFTRVLDEETIEAVVDYIRSEFMSGERSPGRYHTEENGWPDHREQYASAFPFANGEIAIDTPVEALTSTQRRGLELFLTSCISCHDRAKIEDEGVIWRARSASYPRRHYDHRIGPWDAETSATPYQRHDIPPDVSHAPDEVRAGQEVFQLNCAFCHAGDGTGRNWIGSFMEPPAADLTGPRIAGYSSATLRAVILSGVPDTFMPAWRDNLDDRQLDQLVAYIEFAMKGTGDTESAGDPPPPVQTPARPEWKR